MGTGPHGRKARARAHKKHFKKTVMNLRKRTKDDDQVKKVVEKEKTEGKQIRPFDEDLPGGGQFECTHCARFFISEKALKEHERSKDHKRKYDRVKRIENEKSYTQREADAAGGMAPADTAKESLEAIHAESKSSIPQHGKHLSNNEKDVSMDNAIAPSASTINVSVSCADLPV